MMKLGRLCVTNYFVIQPSHGIGLVVFYRKKNCVLI